MARAYYAKSALKGFDFAQLNLGLIYLYGLGVKNDYEKAATLFLSAAQQGNAKAQGYLGYLYSDGMGVKKSLIEAYAWLSVSVANGNENSKNNLNIVKNKLDETALKESELKAKNYQTKYLPHKK